MQPLLFVLTLWNPHHEILVKWGTIYIGTNFLNWLSFWSYVRGYAHPQKWTISNFCCRTFYRSDALLVSSHSTNKVKTLNATVSIFYKHGGPTHFTSAAQAILAAKARVDSNRPVRSCAFGAWLAHLRSISRWRLEISCIHERSRSFFSIASITLLFYCTWNFSASADEINPKLLPWHAFPILTMSQKCVGGWNPPQRAYSTPTNPCGWIGRSHFAAGKGEWKRGSAGEAEGWGRREVGKVNLTHFSFINLRAVDLVKAVHCCLHVTVPTCLSGTLIRPVADKQRTELSVMTVGVVQISFVDIECCRCVTVLRRRGRRGGQRGVGGTGRT